MRVLLLIILVICCLPLCVSGETDSLHTFDPEQSMLALDLGFMYAGDAQILNISSYFINHTYDNKLEYGLPFIPNSLVHRDTCDAWRYSFQTPVNVLLLLIRWMTDKAFYPDRSESFVISPGPIDFILFSPNSFVKYKMVPKWSVGVRTNTDYFFTRVDGLDRGILFTPALELTFHPDRHGAYTLSLTHSTFINFEGDNHHDGVGVKLSFCVNALYN